MQDTALEDAHLLFSLWPSPRPTANTQAARRNGAGPGRQFCRQTNAAVKKARAEQHIMQSSQHRACRLAAIWMRARASAAHLGAHGPNVAKTFPAGRAGGPRGSERAVQVRWPGRRSASQGPRGPPSSARLVPKPPPEALPPMANGSGWRRERGSAARSGTKKRAFVSLQPTGILLHKSA